MENQMLNHIINESDLEHYERFINNNYKEDTKSENNSNLMTIKSRKSPMPQNRFSVPTMLASNVFSNGYLKNHQGKLVKVESLIGNILDCRIGILLDIGADFIAIKLNKSNCSMMIPTSSIKYITIIHDNDYNKTVSY